MNKVKVDKGSFTIKRKAGIYYSIRSEQFLFDDEAKVSFSERENGLRCKFGYISPGDKEFARTMHLERNEIIELRDYLDKVLEEFTQEKSVYIILYNPLIDKKELVEKFEMEKVSNLKLNGYSFHFYKTNKYSYPHSQYMKAYYADEILNERNQRNCALVVLKTNHCHVYAEVYKTTEKHLINIHNYYDASVEYDLQSMELIDDDEEFNAYYHTIDTKNLVKVKLNDEDKEKIIIDAKNSEYPKEYIDSLKKRYKKK